MIAETGRRTIRKLRRDYTGTERTFVHVLGVAERPRYSGTIYFVECKKCGRKFQMSSAELSQDRGCPCSMSGCRHSGTRMWHGEDPRRFEFEGESLTLADIATRVGMSHRILTNRIAHGMDLSRAIEQPVPIRSLGAAYEKRREKIAQLLAEGLMSIAEIARQVGSTYSTVRRMHQMLDRTSNKEPECRS